MRARGEHSAGPATLLCARSANLVKAGIGFMRQWGPSEMDTAVRPVLEQLKFQVALVKTDLLFEACDRLTDADRQALYEEIGNRLLKRIVPAEPSTCSEVFPDQFNWDSEPDEAVGPKDATEPSSKEPSAVRAAASEGVPWLVQSFSRSPIVRFLRRRDTNDKDPADSFLKDIPRPPNSASRDD
jgi:hypothetical protein